MLALDIRPPAGPPSAGFIVLGCLVAAFFVAVFGLLIVHPEFGLAWAAPFLPFSLPPLAFSLVVWLRRRLWKLRESEADSTARDRRYEAALRRDWRPISYEGPKRAITPDAATLHMEWLRPSLQLRGLTPPRAIVIARAKRHSGLPLRVEPMFQEPVEIDALPSRLSAREPHRFLSSFAKNAVIIASFFGVITLIAFSMHTASESPLRISVKAGAALGIAILSLAIYLLGRIRARGWWREILVGPSFIQIRDGGRTNVYTPENTTLVVRPRRCFAQGILAILSTDGDPKGTPSTHIVFFGFDDPGFLALWRAWINPLRADHLVGADVALGSSVNASPATPNTMEP